MLLCLHVVTILVARAGLHQVVQSVISRSEFVQDSSGFSSGFSSSQQAGNDVMLGGGGGASAADGESGGGGYYQWCSSLSKRCDLTEKRNVRIALNVIANTLFGMRPSKVSTALLAFIV